MVLLISGLTIVLVVLLITGHSFCDDLLVANFISVKTLPVSLKTSPVLMFLSSSFTST